MSSRHRVFSPAANPSIDPPQYFLPAKHADDLVSLGRAERLSRRDIRLVATGIDGAVLSGFGYDDATRVLPVSEFRQVYEMRPSAGIEMWQYTANRNAPEVRE